MTKKELLNTAERLNAIDITINDECVKGVYLQTMYISFGIYGMNAAILKDNKNNFYVIKSRSSNLFKHC